MVESDRQEFRDRIFGIADKLALEKGLAAVSVDSVSKLAKAGRLRVTRVVKAWKTRQQALAAEMPDHLRVMAKRLAEEAWLLALIAQRDTQTGRKDWEVDQATPPASKQPRNVRPTVHLPSPPDAAPSQRPPKISLKPAIWSGAKNPEFAKSVAFAINQAGHPLRPRELEAGEFPPSLLDGYDADKPGRAISRALAGSGIEWSEGTWWFANIARPARPKRESIYKSADTPLAKRRRVSPLLIEKAVKFIAGQAEGVHFSAVWDHVDATPDFSEAWLRHALRDHAKREGAEIKMLGDGRYVAVKPYRKYK